MEGGTVYMWWSTVHVGGGTVDVRGGTVHVRREYCSCKGVLLI